MNKASAMKKPKRPGGNPSPSFLFASRKPASTVSPVTRDLMNAIEAAGISGRSIHAKSGIHHVTVSRWRHGVASPRLTDFEHVAQVLGCRLALVPLGKDEDEA